MTTAVALIYCCINVSGQSSSTARLSQRFEREPEDQTTVVGETVVMACRVLNKSGVLQWTKDDFGLGSDRNLSGFERYSMIGLEDEGMQLLSDSALCSRWLIKNKKNTMGK